MSYKEERKMRLLPDGKPRWIRCYDNGGDSTDRYTVVFTNLKMGIYPYVCMSGAPYWPQGVCLHGENNYRPIDTPRYGHLGKKVTFDDLPEDCKRVVLNDYLDYWNLH